MSWFELAQWAGTFVLIWAISVAMLVLCLVSSPIFTLLMLGKWSKIILCVRRKGLPFALVRGLLAIPILCGGIAYIYAPMSYLLQLDGAIKTVVDIVVTLTVAGAALDSLAFCFGFRAAWWRQVAKIDIPPGWERVHSTRTVRIGLELYWLRLAERAVGPVLFLLPISVIMGVIRRMNYFTVYFSDLQVLVLVSASLVPWLLRRLIKSLLRWGLPLAAAVGMISGIANAMNGRTPRDPLPYEDPDPLDWYRWRLAMSATFLFRVATKLDRNVSGGGHPVATVLRATSKRMRSYCQSSQSLVNCLSDDMKNVVHHSILVLLGTAQPRYYQELAALVDAFGDDGSAAVPPPGRRFEVVETLARFGEGSEGLRKVLIIVVMLITLVYFVIGQIPLPTITLN